MKLLYFIYKIENSGGTERIVLSKINYLANQPGYEVYLSYFGNDKSFFPIDEKVHLLPLDDSNSSGSSTRLLRFFKLIKKVKAVVNGAPCRVYACTRCLRSGAVVKPLIKSEND